MVTVKMNFLPCFFPAPSRASPLAKNQLTFSLSFSLLKLEKNKQQKPQHGAARPQTWQGGGMFQVCCVISWCAPLAMHLVATVVPGYLCSTNLERTFGTPQWNFWVASPSTRQDFAKIWSRHACYAVWSKYPWLCRKLRSI